METELRVQASPVPTHTFRGSRGSTAMAPMDWTGSWSKTGRKVVPPSVDFHTPPLAAPAKRVVFPPSPWAAMAEMRPLIAAEPTLRAGRPDSTPSSSLTGPEPAGRGACEDAGAGAGPRAGGGPASGVPPSG